MVKILSTLASGRRTKWALIAAWLAVAALTGPFAGKLPKAEKNDAIAYLPSSAQSTQVNQALAHFPGGQEVPGVAVFVARGRLSRADEQLAAAQVNRAAKVVPAFRPGQPQLSSDGKAIAYSFNLRQPDTAKLSHDINLVRNVLAGGRQLTAYVTGVAGALADSASAFKGIDGLLLAVTGLVVIVLLLLIYRSPFLWVLPLLSVAAAIGLSEWSVYELATRAGVTVSGETGGILTVLVFGAGTDYALLLISRYREELRKHKDCHDAMREALAKAAPAVIASGSTVVLGLLCLLAAELNSESGLGPIGAIGIVSALLAQLTFLPALLVALGRRACRPRGIVFRPCGCSPRAPLKPVLCQLPPVGLRRKSLRPALPSRWRRTRGHRRQSCQGEPGTADAAQHQWRWAGFPGRLFPWASGNSGHSFGTAAEPSSF